MKIHDEALQMTIDKHKIKGKRGSVKGTQKWNFTLLNIQTSMELHAMQEYINNKKILNAVREYLNNTRFESTNKVWEGFQKYIDYQEKRIKKYQK